MSACPWVASYAPDSPSSVSRPPSQTPLCASNKSAVKSGRERAATPWSAGARPLADMHGLPLPHDGFRAVLKAVDDVVARVKHDLAIRCANHGLTKYLYTLEPFFGRSHRKGAPASSAAALAAWANYCAVDRSVLVRQWAHICTCRDVVLSQQPSNNTLWPRTLWSPLLSVEQQAAPYIVRRMVALIVRAWQNAVVERDLVVVTEVGRRAAC